MGVGQKDARDQPKTVSNRLTGAGEVDLGRRMTPEAELGGRRDRAKNLYPRTAWATGCFVQHMRTPFFRDSTHEDMLDMSKPSLAPNVSNR